MLETIEEHRKIVLTLSTSILVILGLILWGTWRPLQARSISPEPSITGGLYFQNNTADNLWVAVGYADAGGNWFSRGWVKVEPGETSRAWPGYLEHRYYAYYARTANEGRTWAGDRQFWVHAQDWQAAPAGLDPQQAASQGFQPRRFRLVDVGQPRERFVVVIE